jgi:hypothetical protein
LIYFHYQESDQTGEPLAGQVRVRALFMIRRGVQQCHQAFPKIFTNVTELSKNYPARLSNVSKKSHRSYQTFLKLSGKVTDIPEKVWQSSRPF